MDQELDHLRFCAFCPNPCRSALDDSWSYRESQTPSALSLVAILVADGKMSWGTEINALLADNAVAVRCRERCPYPFDIPAELEAFRREREGEEA